ncbi:hypothetical protein [Fodinicola feengrottensis]|uniref:hypothetical protein n=1 Tax=Fodinicola feengrottensis TaxID=435914 RepID=UPI0013D5DBDE|nr:hypothetical protein [Fodinicola feengrottensis]
MSSGDGAPETDLPVERRYQVPARWPAGRVPSGDTEFRAAVNWMRHENLVLRQLAVRDLVGLLRPFFESGYRIRDIAEALETSPTGDGYDDGPPLLRWGSVRILQWVKTRLERWLDPASSRPLRPPSADVAQEAAQAKAAHRQQERTYEQLRAAAVPIASSPAAQEALRIARQASHRRRTPR